MALATATSTDRADVAQLVFTAVLPLLGTWVGAVLAYYFTKDNLQAASQTTLDTFRAVGLTPADTQVTGVMIPANRIHPRRDVSDAVSAGLIKLSELYTMMTQTHLGRVPIFLSGKALYVIHEPDIDKFAQSISSTSSALADDKTVDSLLDTADGKKAITAFTAISGTATIADARNLLAKMADAKDVFVTDDGTTAGAVLGWLTNTDLARAN